MSPQTKRSWIAVAVVIVLVGVAFAINRATKSGKSDDAGAIPSRQELVARANLPDCPTTSGAGALELSYVLPVAAWGHGYATEAGVAILAWAAERFDEPVVVCTQSANTASLALAARLGFTELERFEEFGAEQWYGVRVPG